MKGKEIRSRCMVTLLITLFVLVAYASKTEVKASGESQDGVYITPSYSDLNKDCCGDQLTNLTGKRLHQAVAKALANQEVHLFHKYLTKKGYRPDFENSYGVTCDTGCELGVVLTFDGSESEAGIIFLSLKGNESVMGISTTKSGDVLSVYEIDSQGNIVDTGGDMECNGYRGIRYFHCPGQSSCDGVIYHAGEGEWCQGTKACIGHKDTHWHDLTWCGHYSLCKYMRSVYNDPPCGVTWDKCWMSCWDMIFSLKAPGCWPGGGYLSKECHYQIVSCSC